MKTTDNLDSPVAPGGLSGASSGRCDALERCDREIAAIEALDPATHKAYLTVMGRNDWEHEKRLIARGR